MSGHIFFAERWYGFDDATYTAGRLLEILSREPTRAPCSTRCRRAFQHARAQRALRRRRTPRVIELLRGPTGASSSTGARGGTIDGLRADYADGFGLIRASNTTPVLVLRFEGHTPEALQRIQAAVHGGAAQRQARRARGCFGCTPLTAACARLARVAYSLLLRLATPAYLARLWWRGRVQEPPYRLWWGERLGWQPGLRRSGRRVPGRLWLHAVSLGETTRCRALDCRPARAAAPGMRLLLTHGTATGRDAGPRADASR
jgi:hypothetical protein